VDAAVNGERRSAPRLSRGCHGIELARIRPGRLALVIDASAGGVLLETSTRLAPGTRVELQLHRRDSRVSIGGQVLRCAVAAIGPASICYHGAIQFEQVVSVFACPADDGQLLPTDGSALAVQP
jgi:hypothetical protein